MDTNWVSTFDMLAASGVIDFDAPAFLLDQNPRYVGHPDIERLPMENPMYLPQGTKLKDVPDKDLFDKSKDGNLIHNPTWKKALFAVVGTVGAIAAFLFARKGVKGVKTAIKSIKMPKIQWVDCSKAKNFASKVWAGIKKPFTWIASKVK